MKVLQKLWQNNGEVKQIKRWIGVDVGKEGAFAMIPEEGDIEVYPMDEWMLISRLTDWSFDECMVYVEKASVRPGQGISSAGTFMEGAGFIRGVLQTLQKQDVIRGILKQNGVQAT